MLALGYKRVLVRPGDRIRYERSGADGQVLGGGHVRERRFTDKCPTAI